MKPENKKYLQYGLTILSCVIAMIISGGPLGIINSFKMGVVAGVIIYLHLSLIPTKNEENPTIPDDNPTLKKQH